ncbi:unnamed protein product [Strongylus vulgaris]|uniref:Uncharacterized protein n=1 Tax=Strongylus vulgaris TaxID=40348 RepID=A0A3P7JFG0_STRVU|nr:unnamed protein product [Strongylus vulgaris]
MAQLLAAYLMSSAPGKDVSQMRKVCDTFNAHVGPLFDQINRGARRDVGRGRDREDQARAATILELTRFLKLIRVKTQFFGNVFSF